MCRKGPREPGTQTRDALDLQLAAELLGQVLRDPESEASPGAGAIARLELAASCSAGDRRLCGFSGVVAASRRRWRALFQRGNTLFNDFPYRGFCCSPILVFCSLD
jgi:hypothetical protein